jgi:hypothetical protein
MNRAHERAGTGLIARAIWDYWNLGSTARLSSVLRSGSPLSNADRELLADFIESALRRSQRDNRPIIDESVTGARQLRPSDREIERIKTELREAVQGLGTIVGGPEHGPGKTGAADSSDELRELLRRLKNKGSS